jgi:hypothetical protein
LKEVHQGPVVVQLGVQREEVVDQGGIPDFVFHHDGLQIVDGLKGKKEGRKEGLEGRFGRKVRKEGSEGRFGRKVRKEGKLEDRKEGRLEGRKEG